MCPGIACRLSRGALKFASIKSFFPVFEAICVRFVLIWGHALAAREELEPVANSADKNNTPADQRLDGESEVIDLTEEVESRGDQPAQDRGQGREIAPGAHEGQAMEDELAALTRDMPKFRVPQEFEPAEGESAPAAAIFTGRRRTRTQKTGIAAAESPGIDPEETEPQESAELQESDPEKSAAPQDTPAPQEYLPSQTAEDELADYDRQAVVKTIQMRAVDRDTLERQFYAERLRSAPLLADHRFAPGILVHAPRALVARWEEGGPLAQLAQTAAPEAPAESHDDEEEIHALEAGDLESWPQDDEEIELDSAEDIDEISAEDAARVTAEIIADEGAPQKLGEESMLELESDAIELEPDELVGAKPPPKPGGPPALRQASDAGPPRQRSNTPAPPRLSPPPASSDEPDSELGNLVRDLFDDTDEAARQQEKQERQRAAEEAKAEGASTPKRPRRSTGRPRTPRDTWCQEVFSEEYLRTLPRDIHRQTRRDVAFIERALNLKEGDVTLDLACGFGRHAIELTRRGHEVVGLDLSLPLLQKALHEAQRQNLAIKFIHGDMRDLQFEGIFGACFLWQTSFGYFDEQTNFRVLRGIHRALKPGGQLLIDVLNRDHIVPQMPHRIWWEGVNCVFLEEVEFDYSASVLHTKRSFIYEDGTPPLEQNSYIRLYSAHELGQVLRAAGFNVVQLSGELHHPGQFLGTASTRIVIQAQKRPAKNG